MENQIEEKEDRTKKKKSIEKNYIYNLIYQLFLLIVPIVVTPYVARVLGDDGSGKYSFSFSLVTYFTLFAALGFATYGQREIAKQQGNKEKQSLVFWEVVIARLIPSLLTLIIYFVLLFLNVYGEEYRLLMLILSINVFAVIFDVVFFFQGNEEFGKIVLRNVIIKVIGITLIYVFVKDRDDLWIYTLIQSLTAFISNISLWIYMPKLLKKVKVKDIRPLKHLIPTLILFLPTIAVSVYTTLDKTLIGILIKGSIEVVLEDGTVVVKKLSDIENGNYEYAEKLVKMSMTVITSLGVVMVPRNTKMYAEGNIGGVEKNILSTSRFVLLIGIPLVLGCIAVADNIIPWYLGQSYTKASTLMKILSPIILIIGLSNVFGLQFLIPSGQDGKFTTAIVIGAIFNFVLNIILIKQFNSYGAAIATIIAELIVTILMFIFIRKHIKLGKIILGSWKSIASGIIMFIPCYYIGQILSPSILNTFLIAIIGASIYFVCLVVFREYFIIEGFKYLKKIIYRNK